MNGDPLRRAADTVDAVAIGEDKAALIVLWARAAERMCLGTLTDDDVNSLLSLMRGR